MSRATQCLGPISGETLDMLRVKAMAEGMGHNLVGHYTLMPGASQTAQAFVAACRLKHSVRIHSPAKNWRMRSSPRSRFCSATAYDRRTCS